MLKLAAALLVASTVAAVDHANYEGLIGHPQFANKSQVEKFIMGLAELNRLQREINGQQDVAADPTGQSFLDAVGREEAVRPDMQPFLFEGDIILSEEELNRMIHDTRIEALFKKHGRKPPVKRSLTAGTYFKWTMPIPYRMDRGAVNVAAVQRGIDKWQELSCVTFRHDEAPRGPSLYFVNRNGYCQSEIGRKDWAYQEVSIGPGCNFLGTVTHEIAHALGMWHEQSRPERDDYITVGNNVVPGYDFDYTKVSKSAVNNYGVKYDYGSVMHYDEIGFSTNGRPTIRTKDPNYQWTIGQREEPSFADVKQINAAYCSDVCSGKNLDCKDGGYPDPKNCKVCRCPTGLGGTLCEKVQPSHSKCGDTDLMADISLKKMSVDGNMNCYYRITAPAGRKVFVSFTANFQFQWRKPCSGSYTEVKYRKDKVVSGARFCDQNQQPSITSEGTTILILYKGSPQSRLKFSYRFDPATPVDSTVAPVTTSTAISGTKDPNCGSETTTEPPTTTTDDGEEPTTTTDEPDEEWTTERPWFTTEESTCEWSRCTRDCGGCGFKTRTCDGEKEVKLCGKRACKHKKCCRNFKYDDGYCYYDKDSSENSETNSEERGGWVTDSEESPFVHFISKGKDRHRIHIQPGRPQKIQLPKEKLTIHADKVIFLRASRVSAKPAKIARRVPVLKGTGDAPANGEVGIEGSGILDG